MGLLSRLRGTDRPDEVQAAIDQLQLPEGWTFDGFRWQLFCRRPVKLSACGSWAKGTDGQQVLVVTDDHELGVPGVRALPEAIAGRLPAASHWAPPVIRSRGDGPRTEWEQRDPESDQEGTARDAALAVVPGGSTVTNVDSERFGSVTAYAVVAHLPDDTGVAGVGLAPAGAWEALASRLRGELEVAALWVPPTA